MGARRSSRRSFGTEARTARFRPIAAALTRRTDRLTPTEILVIVVVLAGVGLIAYGSYIAHGGFYADDWYHVAFYRFADPPRYWSMVQNTADVLGGRPIVALLMPLPQVLFGADADAHLALALGLGIVVSLCLYLLLRTLSIAPLHAGAIAVLALLFPGSDAIRLWPTGSILSISVVFFLLGLVLALRGLRYQGVRGVAMHAGADALYVLSVLTYEVTAGAALLAGALYLGRASTRTVARRWLADVVVVVAALGYSLASTTNTRHVGTLSERIGDLGPFLRQALLLVPDALLPVASPGRVLQGLVLLGVAVIVGAALLRVRRGPEPALREWLRWVAVAAIAIGAAYFMFLGSHLHPGDPGIDMRVNVFAGIAYAMLAYAIVATASNLLLRSTTATIVTLVAATAIAVGYGIRLADQETTWRRATTLQETVLQASDSGLGPLPPRSTLLTFDFPSHAAPAVPVFTQSWDLGSALKLHADDPTLRGYPVYDGIAVHCGRNGLVVSGPGEYGRFEVAYGRTFFLDVRRARGEQIRSRPGCAAALANLAA